VPEVLSVGYYVVPIAKCSVVDRAASIAKGDAPDGKRRLTARHAAYVIEQAMARGIDKKGVRDVFGDRAIKFCGTRPIQLRSSVEPGGRGAGATS
jgi:hypothetical protein